MTVLEWKEALGATLLAGEAGTGRPVTGCYVGDLLSWVMGRAEENCLWITVMGNVNAVAVAKLADISCILLCESAHLDAEAKAQADAQGIPVLSSELPAYRLAVAAGRVLEAE